MTDAAPASEWPAADLEHLGRCPVCGNVERAPLHEALEDRIFRTAPGRWKLWRCRSCGCGYVDPRPTRDSIGAAYRRYFSRSVEERPAPSTRRARILERLRNGYLNSYYGYALDPASRVGAVTVPVVPNVRWSASLPVRGLTKPPGRPRLLDVGFGDGSFLRFMRGAGWDVEGLEADPAAVAAASSAGLDVALGTLEDAPHRPESFDAITLSHVVEHLHDPVNSLRAIHRAGLPQTRGLETAVAAVAIVLPADPDRAVHDAYDDGRVAERLLVAASILEIGAGISWIRTDVRPAVAKILHLPPDRMVRTIVQLGHPTIGARAPKSAPGTARLPRDEVVFQERWPADG